MPTSSGPTTRRPRSAEQTARLLLSNAFRYDTWECSAAKQAVQRLGGAATTVKLTFNPLAKQDAPMAFDACNIILFDTTTKSFVGAAYRIDARALNDAVVFQGIPKQMVVVELLVRDTRPQAPLEEMRATHFATCLIENLSSATAFKLRPGNAHLLFLEQGMWPTTSQASAPAAGMLGFKCEVDKDAALAQLMSELVPPGVFVSESFTRASPLPSGKTFRLSISGIEITAAGKDAGHGLSDPDADWAVAAVAHNGYQQLCSGVEVPLVMSGGTDKSNTTGDKRTGTSSASPNSTHDNDEDDDSYSYSYSNSESNSTSTSKSKSGSGKKRSSLPSASKSQPPKSKSGGKKGDAAAVLHSELPVEIDGLPVHSTTSLVLAIRCRTPDSKVFKVVGFCVFPLCMMPMKNRDVRVENLPALRGPFSCEDARMLMVDSSTPYGRVPIAMTITLEYYDVEEPAAAAAAGSPLHTAKTKSTLPDGTAASPRDTDSFFSADVMGSVSKTPVVADSLTLASAPAITPEGPASPLQPDGLVGSSTALSAPEASVPHLVVAAKAEGQDGIFKLLCTIMEELAKVRETQDAILQQMQTGGPGGHHPDAMSQALKDRLNNKLADGPIDLIDLAPRPLSVSWSARRAIQEGVQPILHPLRGSLLDENAPAVGSLPASLYGIRFEGITLDLAIDMPEQLCFMFSFGPLPYQQAGPMEVSSVEKNNVCESYKLFDGERGGYVWCEPVEALENISMNKYKECAGANAEIYVHVFDAVSMFYVATANLKLSQFHRPVQMEAGVVQTDVALQRDFSLTEHVLPPQVFPVMRNAGQLHLSLFCVGAAQPSAMADAVTAQLKEPSNGPRLIVAKKLPNVDKLQRASRSTTPNSEGENNNKNIINSNKQDATSAQADGMVLTPLAPAGVNTLHWQRAEHLKKQMALHDSGSAALPGVPGAHVQGAQHAADMEYRLRYAEKERNDAKTKAIAQLLRDRLTAEHTLRVAAWRPERVSTPFQNPYSVPTQFFVEVTEMDRDVCEVLDSPSFYLGPRERTTINLVVRFNPTAGQQQQPSSAATRLIEARVFNERREAARFIRMHVTLGPPLVDRRYEVFGPPGTEVTKRLLSRLFASSSFPITSNQTELLKRMKDLCAFADTSSPRTKAETNAIIDPVTQSYVTAWEEVSITTTVPKELGRQRVEYLTLFYDVGRSKVYETWELCIFACECLTMREIPWGQTTSVGLPAEGTEDMYCSQSDVAVERAGPSYVLRLTPKQTGTQRMMLHTLVADSLRKTLVTIPVGYPTPSFTQTIELSLADVQGPVFRRLSFTHRGDMEDMFHVHHNYKFQLRLSPTTFALAPGDSQFISLQFDMLTLPPGQLEGRWPMWIFINNSKNKTVESYYLQVVLRAHPVVSVVN